jgi:hypothetical protein
MKLLQAFERLGSRRDRSVLDVTAQIAVPRPAGADSGEPVLVDAWPELATALASLSGWLDDAKTDAELDEAIGHGRSLLDAGILDEAAVQAECQRLVCVLMAAGERGHLCSDGCEGS